MPVVVPMHIRDALLTVVSYFRDRNNLSPIASNSSESMPALVTSIPRNSPFLVQTNIDIRHHVKLNRKTNLEVLYTYRSSDVCVEYPETNKGYIGHLFTMDLKKWVNPARNFVYSQGELVEISPWNVLYWATDLANLCPAAFPIPPVSFPLVMHINTDILFKYCRPGYEDLSICKYESCQKISFNCVSGGPFYKVTGSTGKPEQQAITIPPIP